MIRNLKSLGLTLAAVFALGAVAASMASAQTQGKITTDGVSVTLDMVEDGTNAFAIPGLPGVKECPGSTMVGHKYNVTPHEQIPANETTFTVTPNYVNCESGGHKVTITMNGCDFVFHVGATTATPVDTYALTADVICPPGKVIEVHVYLSATESKTLTCTTKIPEQKGITGFDISNEIVEGKTNDTLTATGKSKNIREMREGLCGAGETLVAETEINYTITGTNLNKEKTGVTITDA